MRSTGGTKKTTFGFPLLLALVIVCLVGAASSKAQIEWQGASGGNWDVTGNWVGGVVPNGSVSAENLTANTILLNSGTYAINGFNSSNSSANFQLFGGELDANTPGTSTFSMTGQLMLGGSSTLSGFVVSAGGGVVNGVSQTTTLDGITFAGGTNFSGALGSNTIVKGTFTNSGVAQIDGGSGSNTFLTLGTSTTFSGVGAVTLSTSSGGGNAFIQGNGETLTNSGTINGNGFIGNGSLAVINSGIIDGNVSGGTLALNLTGGVTNTGTIEASGGGTLDFSGVAPVNNSGGNITAVAAGDTVLIGGNTLIQGGTLNNTGGGTLETGVSDTARLDGSTNGELTLNGTYTGTLSSQTFLTGTIQNNGTFQINGGSGNNTELTLNGSATLNGGGVVSLSTSSGGGSAYIQGNGQTLTNNSTIGGTGIVGNGSLAINNAGTITANVPGVLTLNGTGLITNTGLLSASGGGILNLDGVTINNDGGNIKASASTDTVLLGGNTVVQGGTLNNVSGGTLGTTASNSAFLDGSTASGAVAINGTYLSDLNSSTYLLGTINNSGNLVVSGGNGNNTYLRADTANVNLEGGGAVTLSTVAAGGGAAQIIQATGGLTLTNVNNTIQGEGVIGNNSLTFVNEAGGVVNANSTGGALQTTLALQGLSGTTINAGLMEASNSGILALDSVILTNAGANVTANAGATVQLNGTTITGGTLNNNGGAFFGTPNGQQAVLDGGTLGSLTLNGTYTGDFNSNTYIAGTIINNNNILINGGNGTNSYLRTDSTNVLLQGGGTLTLNTETGGGLASLIQGAGGQTITNVNNLIQGEGEIGNNSLTLVNQSVINANSTGGPLLTTLLLQGLGGTTVNQGLMEATNNGVLQLSGVDVNNQGGNITTSGSSASVQLSASTTISGGNLNNNAGAFLGTVNGNTVTLDGSTAGALTINGTYTSDFNTSTYIGGTIINNNNLLLNGGNGTNSYLRTNSADVLLQGGGTLTLNSVTGGGIASIIQGAGGEILTNVNNLIQGEGEIGNNSLTLLNESVVNANSTGSGTINTLLLQGLSLTNQGLVEATNSGVLQIAGITVNNAGGTISAVGSDASVQISGSSVIQGGTLTNNGGAFLGTVNGNTATLDGSTASGPVTINGTYTSDYNTSTYLYGTINNQGNLLLNGGNGTNSYLRLGTSTVLFTGGGTVTMNDNLAGGGTATIMQAAGGITLENFNNTIQGNGEIGNNGLSLLNDAGGTVLANVAGGTLALDAGGTVTNNGTYEANSGSLLHLENVSFTNFSGSTLTGGTYIANGTVSNAGTIQIDALGTTGGEIVNNAATIILNGPNSNIVDEDGLDALTNLAANTTASSNLTVEGGRTLIVTNGFSNAGTVWVGTGSSMLLAGTNPTFTQSAGITTVNGNLGNIDPMSYDLNAGILAGGGTVTGNVIGTGGSIAPGEVGSTGELTISGNLVDSGSTLDIRLGGTGANQWDQLNVTGDANLGAGSILDVALFNGFTPTNGETFTFLDFSTLTSQGVPDFFGMANGLTTPGGVFSIEELGGDNLTLLFTANQGPPPPSNGTPEPAPMVLLASGALVWALLRKRARR